MSLNEIKKGEVPCVIVIGSDGKDALDIVKGIVGDALPEPETSYSCEKYWWQIDNKYYTAEVELCSVKFDNDFSLLNNAEALIFYLDSAKPFALEDADKVLHYLEDAKQSPEVLLLVCNSFAKCVHDGHIELPRNKAEEWCIEHGWELVELNPEISTNDGEEDLEDAFLDSWGIERIKQALHAHTWSNLKLKAEKDNSIDQLFNCLNVNDLEQQSEMPYVKLKDKEEENDFEEDLDEFSALFSSLGEMKQKAESLPVQERRLYAEKMAVAFWKSLGGDEEELQGGSDSEDDSNVDV